MSFYHVLPSNTSPDTFPKNTASFYSTPIENPYILHGEWEVALMSMTHSNCIDTFNDDRMFIIEPSTSTEALKNITTPVKYVLDAPPKELSKTEKIDRMLKQLQKFTYIFRVKRTKEGSDSRVTWGVVNPEFYVIMSKDMHKFFELHSCVLAGYEHKITNLFDIKTNNRNINDAYIILGQMRKNATDILIKPSHNEMSADELVNAFNNVVTTGLRLEFKDDSKTHIRLLKNSGTDKVIIFSKGLKYALGLEQGAMREKEGLICYEHYLYHSFRWHWSVTIIDLSHVETAKDTFRREIVLPREQFLFNKAMINALNQINERITFSESGNIIFMELKGVKVEFEDELRDVLGFDNSYYEGSDSGSSTFSLDRNIHYFYIYSNISHMVRIGDTKAPLLGVVPFNAKPCRIKTERNFKVPMYVAVSRDHISQIDIGIYDDAGKVVPFHKDSVTNIRLHFRQSSLP